MDHLWEVTIWALSHFEFGTATCIKQLFPGPPHPRPKRFKKIQAIYNYEPQQGDKLTLYEGEVADVLKEDEDGWTMVKKADGGEGFVPTSYLGIQEY